MKEMLIPYKGQDTKMFGQTEEDKEKEELRRRLACL